jgi:hypothetical protein
MFFLSRCVIVVVIVVVVVVVVEVARVRYVLHYDW